jgi:hypothetical protein
VRKVSDTGSRVASPRQHGHPDSPLWTVEAEKPDIVLIDVRTPPDRVDIAGPLQDFLRRAQAM